MMNPFTRFKVWDKNGVLVKELNALSKKDAKETAGKYLGLSGKELDEFVESCAIEDVDHEEACFNQRCRDSYGFRESE